MNTLLIRRTARKTFIRILTITLLVLAQTFALPPEYRFPFPVAKAAPPPSGFFLQSADAYAWFDDSNDTWEIGNSFFAETLQLSAAGELQEISLMNRSSGKRWDLSSDKAKMTLTDRAEEETAEDGSTGWILVDTSAESLADGTLGLRIETEHPASGLGQRLELRVRPGHPVIESRVLVTNLSGQPMRLSRLDSILLGLAPTNSAAWEATTFSNSGLVKASALSRNDPVIAQAPRASGAPQEHLPYVVMRDLTSSEGLLAGLRWSANWQLLVVEDENGRTYLRGGLHLDDSDDDSLPLVSGGTVESPWGFVGLFQGDVDDAARVMNNYSKATDPSRPDWAALPPVTWNSWYAYFLDVSEERLYAEVDRAAELGVEVFYIDYGWSKALGDWQPDPDRFPNGLANFARYVHDKGMKFGLWVAFGGASPISLVAIEYPDFIALQPEPAAKGIDGSLVYCLTPAKGWVVSELDRIVTEYEVDWVKFDQPMIAACNAIGHGHFTNLAGSLYDNNIAFYSALETLQRNHPKLLIENCFNGSGYLDYGTRRYTTVAWLTDESGQSSTAQPTVQQYFYTASHGFRPDYLIQWLATTTYAPAALGRTSSLPDLSYQAYSSMAGSWGLSLRLTEMDEQQLALVKELVSIYKSVRPLIAKGDFYHLVGPSDLDNPWGGGWFVVEYFDPKAEKGAVLAVRNGEDSPGSILTPLRGLDPDSVYRVSKLEKPEETSEYWGNDLLQPGLILSAEPRQGSWLLIDQVKP